MPTTKPYTPEQLKNRRERDRELYANDPEYRARRRATTIKSIRENPDGWRNSQARYRRSSKFKMAFAVAAEVSAWVYAARYEKELDRVPSRLGLSIRDFRKKLEGTFSGEMGWENYGSLWEIHHRVPKADFDLWDEAQWAACNHHSNLEAVLKTRHARGTARKRK
jgi:hypothetical protein